ncbi:hypothetical protein QBC47DRAFT_395306 [Echria macrotheca]|uniref:Uncharacterized protein n=1 Tax=Echria macrotheca TaxID=438768 RepID=A0AAJ0F1A4_9PEZI|nr:hypothetical protein QBC47DRAFT_395306 [Echria macrotheca]
MENLPKDHFVTSMQYTRHTYQDQYPSIDPTNPELSMAGKVVIITGASRGLGALGVVPAFAKAGPKAIVLVATNASKLAAVEAEVKKINPAVQTLSVATNISDADSVAALFDKVKATYGHADVLVNVAAVLAGGGTLHEEDPALWWQNFEVNTKGAFLLAKYFVATLPSPDTPATIINFTTGAAWIVIPHMSGYGISKLAVMQLTAHLAATYPNITAVAVHPGLIETDMFDPVFKRFSLDTPELAGGTALWLASDKARFLTGRTVAANWSVDDLEARKDEITAGKDLQVHLVGTFGKEQFE